MNCLIIRAYIIYQENKVRLLSLYLNQSSNGNFIHKDHINSPILVEILLIFPVPWAPAPFPKSCVRALTFCLAANKNMLSSTVKRYMSDLVKIYFGLLKF